MRRHLPLLLALVLLVPVGLHAGGGQNAEGSEGAEPETLRRVTWQRYAQDGEVSLVFEADSAQLGDDASMNVLRPRITDARGNTYTAQRGIFSTRSDHIRLMGESRLSAGSMTLSADTIDLYSEEQKLEFAGDVQGKDAGFAFSADTGEYDHAKGELVLSGDVRTSMTR